MEHWLFTEAPSQLTYEGIVKLNKAMKEEELGIFFRNNHFNTILKLNGSLYILVTDIGFLDKQEIVWELLNEVRETHKETYFLPRYPVTLSLLIQPFKFINLPPRFLMRSLILKV